MATKFIPPGQKPKAKHDLPLFLRSPGSEKRTKIVRELKRREAITGKPGWKPPVDRIPRPPICTVPPEITNMSSAARAIRESQDYTVDTKDDPSGFYRTCLGLSVFYLRSRLDYDPVTGEMTWAGGPGTGQGGSKSQTVRRDSPVVVIAGKRRNAVGIIFLLHLGRLPRGYVQFVDNDTSNWMWSNLQE